MNMYLQTQVTHKWHIYEYTYKHTHFNIPSENHLKDNVSFDLLNSEKYRVHSRDYSIQVSTEKDLAAIFSLWTITKPFSKMFLIIHPLMD